MIPNVPPGRGVARGRIARRRESDPASTEIVKTPSFTPARGTPEPEMVPSENPPGPDSFKSDEKLYITAQCGGLRIFDTSDPYRVQEIGYYVPGTPKVYYSPYGLGGHSSGVDMQDVFVDNKGLMYVSLSNGGLEILESKV